MSSDLCSSVEALRDIADAVRHLRSDERFAELEARVKALEEKYEVLVAVYEVEMVEKVMVEAEDVEMDRGSDGCLGVGEDKNKFLKKDM